MDTFLIATGVVALAEIGDKTQLLAFILATRFRRSLPIIAGILVATLLNHALAGVFGAWITTQLGPTLLRWVLGLAFLGMAAWTLVPDRLDAADAPATRYGVFGTALIGFFLAEMGDKTQIATVALAARFQDLYAVIIGTTLGMLIVNVPAVLFGERLASHLPVRLVRLTAAAIFVALGLLTLTGVGRGIAL
ncbi:MAG: TMEM165/GDT1 family protein [Gammaproteobacteria bacterium]|nr:TMEM165/GDT1 family protein [Gammaproteobacteria bacterium]